MTTLNQLKEETLARISEAYDCEVAELFEWEENDEVQLFNRKEALADWLYFQDDAARRFFIESALIIEKEDFDEEQTLLDVVLEQNNSVYIDEPSHIAVYVFGIF